MATDQTIHDKQPPAAPGRGSQVDENLVIYFMWPKATVCLRLKSDDPATALMSMMSFSYNRILTFGAKRGLQ